jgi:outer membrane protein assembly factor BamB
MAQSGGALYIGGGFTFVGGLQRARLAAVDTSTGAPTAWHPATNGTVQTIAISGGVVYVGGGFSTIGPGPIVQFGDSLRSSLAAVDAATGALLSWNPNPTSNVGGSVAALVASGGAIYVGTCLRSTLGPASRRPGIPTRTVSSTRSHKMVG